MIAKLQSVWSWGITHLAEVIVFGFLIFLLVASFWFRTAPLIVNHDPVTPVQPILPKVDYSVDKNRMQCIFNRIPPDVQKLCEEAFPYSK